MTGQARLLVMSVPDWAHPQTTKPAPPPLLLVQAFINTRRVEEGTDLLSDVADARAWLSAAGLLGARVTRSELAEIRQVRESLRVLVIHNGGGPAPAADDLRPLRKLAAARRARLSVDDAGRVGIAPENGLLGLLLVIRDAQADGTWQRLKACGNPDCLWAFFDRSRNRQGAWCDMASCGNRLKNREFRARRR
jgi:predicted RNA-binding Zn ribbon-like protein